MREKIPFFLAVTGTSSFHSSPSSLTVCVCVCGCVFFSQMESTERAGSFTDSVDESDSGFVLRRTIISARLYHPVNLFPLE